MVPVRMGTMVAISCLLFACSRPPPNLYVLTPTPDNGHSVQASAPTVAIVRVQLPDYLDRREIVSRQGQNGLQVSDNNHWGEALDESVQRVLAEDLTRSLGNARVVGPVEGRGKHIPYEYLVTLEAFEPDSGQAVMRGHWQLRDLLHDRKVIAEGPIDLSRQAKAGDYPAMVAALNQNLNDAGQEIANATEPEIRR